MHTPEYHGHQYSLPHLPQAAPETGLMAIHPVAPAWIYGQWLSSPWHRDKIVALQQAYQNLPIDQLVGFYEWIKHFWPVLDYNERGMSEQIRMRIVYELDMIQQQQSLSGYAGLGDFWNTVQTWTKWGQSELTKQLEEERKKAAAKLAAEKAAAEAAAKAGTQTGITIIDAKTGQPVNPQTGQPAPQPGTQQQQPKAPGGANYLPWILAFGVGALALIAFR